MERTYVSDLSVSNLPNVISFNNVQYVQVMSRAASASKSVPADTVTLDCEATMWTEFEAVAKISSAAPMSMSSPAATFTVEETAAIETPLEAAIPMASPPGLGEKQREKNLTILQVDRGETSDEAVHGNAVRKMQLAQDFLDVLRASSIDCAGSDCMEIPRPRGRPRLDKTFDPYSARDGRLLRIRKRGRVYLIDPEGGALYDPDAFERDGKLAARASPRVSRPSMASSSAPGLDAAPLAELQIQAVSAAAAAAAAARVPPEGPVREAHVGDPPGVAGVRRPRAGGAHEPRGRDLAARELAVRDEDRAGAAAVLPERRGVPRRADDASEALATPALPRGMISSGSGAAMLRQRCGTPAFVAPEILPQDSEYDNKVDVWSAGVILYILLSGFPPFWGDDLQHLLASIMTEDLKFTDPAWELVSQSGKDLIRGMMAKDPSSRPSVQEALAHPWMMMGL